MAPPRNSAAKAPSNMLPGSGTDVTPMSMPQLVTVLCSPPDTSATYNVQPRENLTIYKLLWDSAALKFTVTVQVRTWGRPPVCRLTGPLARCSGDLMATESETP